MKALLVHPYWATSIALGMKYVECRSWKTDHRGPLLICASEKPWESGSICKHALCVVNLVDCVPFTEDYLEDAFLDEMPSNPNKRYFAWIFDGIIPLVPFEVHSDEHFFEVEDDKIVCMLPEENPAQFYREHYEPLMRFGDEYVSEFDQREAWDDLLDEIEETYDYVEE